MRNNFLVRLSANTADKLKHLAIYTVHISRLLHWPPASQAIPHFSITRSIIKLILIVRITICVMQVHNSHDSKIWIFTHSPKWWHSFLCTELRKNTLGLLLMFRKHGNRAVNRGSYLCGGQITPNAETSPIFPSKIKQNRLHNWCTRSQLIINYTHKVQTSAYTFWKKYKNWHLSAGKTRWMSDESTVWVLSRRDTAK